MSLDSTFRFRNHLISALSSTSDIESVIRYVQNNDHSHDYSAILERVAEIQVLLLKRNLCIMGKEVTNDY